MVLLPICERCAAGEELCPVDRDKLERGLITEEDIRVSRLLYRLDKIYRIGDSVEMVGVVDVGPFYILLAKGDISRLIGKRGRVIRALAREMGKPVRIVEVDVDVKKSVQDLMGKVRVVGVSKIKEGEGVTYKVYLMRSDMKYWPYTYADAKRAVEMLLGHPVELEMV